MIVRLAAASNRLLLLASEITRDGSGLPDHDAFRQRVMEALSQLADAASKSNYSPRDVSEAQYALVAFIDEAVQGSSWEHRDAWSLRPMQVELFGNRDAGERFFEHLESNRKSRDVLEVYYLCLALGFQGRNRSSDEGAERLYDLMNGLGRDFAREAPEALCPQPSRELAPPARRSSSRAFVLAGFAILLLAGLTGVYFALELRRASDEALASMSRS